MKIIGLTGGTGSGKTTISKILAERGAKVIDADIVAREIVRRGQKALGEIAEVFGADIILQNGQLDRKKLGSIVFKQEEKLILLNSITHKYIFEEIKNKIENEKVIRKNNLLVIDAAILIESGLFRLCDSIWVVISDFDIKLKRIMERDHLSEADAQNRINAQTHETEMLAFATSIIYNNGDLDDFKFRVIEMLEKWSADQMTS
jgi:dephospho-CoA kinase